MTDKKPDELNLDLITMVQNARMMHDQEATPSQVPGVYWVEAKNPAADLRKVTPRSGEWRIPTTLDAMDEQWAIIKAATEAGELGYKAKVSTQPAHEQSQREDRLICVRTYDADDTADVARIEHKLRELGFAPVRYVRDK